MKWMRWSLALLVATVTSSVVCLAQEGGSKAPSPDLRAMIAGTWRGNSVCLDRASPCHDEVNVYRFAKIAGKPYIFLVTASKVVDGKEIVMGSGQWRYDDGAKTLVSESPRIRLTILRANWMEGALSLDDGREYRKIRLKKAS